MAGAEIIATAMAILLLVVVSYVLVGCIITSGEITASAQKDYTLLKESQLRTAIDIPSTPNPAFNCEDRTWIYFFIFSRPGKECMLTFNITNTGSEMIGNFDHMDVYVNTSEDIIRGPNQWFEDPYDVFTLAGYVKYLTFVPSGGNNPSGTWSYTELSPQLIHPGMSDPGEMMNVTINNYRFRTIPAHYSITVATPNGIIDTYYT